MNVIQETSPPFVEEALAEPMSTRTEEEEHGIVTIEPGKPITIPPEQNLRGHPREEEGEVSPPIGCQGCCSCPHGGRETAILILVTLIAWLFSGFAMGGCELIRAEDWTVGMLEYKEKYQPGGECTHWTKGEYHNEVYDATWKAAHVFAAVAGLMLLVSAVLAFSLCCAAYPQKLLTLWVYLDLGIFLLYGMCFIVFASSLCNDYTCELGNNGRFLIAALLVWSLASLLILCLPVRSHTTHSESAVSNQGQRDFLCARVYLSLIAFIALTNAMVIALRNTSFDG